ncbi:hypothetical protein DM860_012194 [Cuscuta australis]|uniref:Uncharacterized protein n=1 Tax=Cuscuta australis TaxID=267555 RepID=A0A328EAE4_9ASTE|nr:hypothetical protein DM860_012194 [Cuscuta australis]
MSERLGKNPGKARVGWERPQPSQVESSHREQHQGEKDRRSASSSSYSMRYTTTRWSAAEEDTPLALIFDGRRHATRKAINNDNLEFTEGDLKTTSVPWSKNSIVQWLFVGISSKFELFFNFFFVYAWFLFGDWILVLCVSSKDFADLRLNI